MSTVLRSLEGGIVVLTIHRPEARNALDAQAYRALASSVAEADADGSVRAVILTGAGGHFTAGNDIRDFQAPLEPGEPAPISFLRSLAAFSKPLLAAVEGVAVGIGTTLLLHCDLVFAGRGARLRMPFVQLGLCPEGASTFLLPRAVGTRRAVEWLMLGREITAAEAAEAGLVTAAVEDGGALARAVETARQLVALPAGSLRATKALLRRPGREGVAAAFEAETEEFIARRDSPEAQAAFAAFLARRGR